MTSWKVFLGKLKHPKQTLHIGLVDKYTAVPDAYKSIYEALTHAGAHRYVEVYNASEGFFAVQDQVDSNSMLLLLDHGVF